MEWRGSLRVGQNGPTFPIEALNLPLMDHKVIVITQSMGSELAAKSATLAFMTPLPQANRYRVNRVLQQQTIVPPVQGDEVVMAGEGVAATWLALYAPKGSEVQLDYGSRPDWQTLRTAVGGGPILVKDGIPYRDPDSPAPIETNTVYPVSGIGISRDGKKLSLVVVDGTKGKQAKGLTRPQFSWYLQTIGAWNAMAFDSGGSAQMAVRRPGDQWAGIINTPSDGKERPVADGLFIYG